MHNITTILFDIDGTLLNTDEFILQATEHAFSSLGYPVPDRATIKKIVGIPFPEYYIVLAGLSDTEKIDALIEAHRNFQYKNYHLAKLFPRALDTLNTLKAKGYKMAAVTSRSKKTSLQTLIDAEIHDLFDTIVSFEDADARKPDPAPLLKALANLSENAGSAVMVGDSHLDIEAGKNAHTKTIRAAYGFNTDNLHEPEPDYIIDDITEVLKIL